MGKKGKDKQDSKAKRLLGEVRERLIRLLQDHSAWAYESQIASLAEMSSLLGKMDVLQGLNSIVEIEDQDSVILRFQEWLKLHNVRDGAKDGGGDGDDCKSESAWELRSAGAYKGRGVFATRDIPFAEAVFKIHTDVMFSPSFGRAVAGAGAGADSTFQRVLFDLKDNEPVALATSLAHHASCPTSFFRPYIDALPRRYSVAAYWPPAILHEIVDPKVRARVVNNVRAQALLYLRVCNTLAHHAQLAKSTGEGDGENLAPLLNHGLSWDLFRWAMSTISSRQNSIPLVGLGHAEDGSEVSKGSALALVPGWDMMNHQRGPLTTDFIADSSSLIFFPMTDIKAGEEICMCYGSRSNQELLIYSGFVSEGNTNDELVVEVRVPQDELFKMRKLILKSILGGEDLLPAGMASVDIGMSLVYNVELGRVELSSKVWSMLIAMAARKDELALVLRSADKTPSYLFPLLSLDSQRVVWTVLLEMLQRIESMWASQGPVSVQVTGEEWSGVLASCFILRENHLKIVNDTKAMIAALLHC